LMKEAALDPPLFAKQMRPAFDNSGIPKDQIEREIEKARQQVLAGALDRPESPEIRLEAMFMVGFMIANSLKKKDCELVFATRYESFITGDVPVGTQSDNGLLGSSFAKSDTHVWLPLSRKLCVHWPRPPDRYGWARMPPRGVRMLNRNVM